MPVAGAGEAPGAAGAPGAGLIPGPPLAAEPKLPEDDDNVGFASTAGADPSSLLQAVDVTKKKTARPADAAARAGRKEKLRIP